MWNLYVTKVVDKEKEWEDSYIEEAIDKIFQELGLHAVTLRKTRIGWGKPGKREWHNAIEIEWGQKEYPEKEMVGILVYLINKMFTGAKAVYSVGKSSGSKPLFYGMHVD